jgi:hypothetical protein
LVDRLLNARHELQEEVDGRPVDCSTLPSHCRWAPAQFSSDGTHGLVPAGNRVVITTAVPASLTTTTSRVAMLQID